VANEELAAGGERFAWDVPRAGVRASAGVSQDVGSTRQVWNWQRVGSMRRVGVH